MAYFSHSSTAKRYAEARPYFHPLVMDRIAKFWPGQVPFAQALDVGCGTGMSCEALLIIAGKVVGTDISAEMLAEGRQHPDIRYVQAPAEALPFENESFDLITASMAFHWFDRAAFLYEARRLLKPGGKVVVYGHGFSGEMHKSPAFKEWHDHVYLKRYPAPPRIPYDKPLPQGSGFSEVKTERFRQLLRLSAHDITAYLLTQSNVIAKVEMGDETLEDVDWWIYESVQPYFSEESAKFQFSAHIRYLEPQSG
jgi:SAM-dependent methyltransferase